jgi:LPXTG-site transpeptidase (sortase) family protein
VTKGGDPLTAQVGDTVTYTIEVFNNGSVDATNVTVEDTKPSFLTITNVSVVPDTNPTDLALITWVINGSTLTVDIGTVTPTDLFTITVETVVNGLGQPPGGANVVEVFADVDDDPDNNVDDAFLQIRTGGGDGFALPETGFTPGEITILPAQPERLAYTAYDQLWLEIPSLGVQMPIVGVPLTGEGWDVTWLSDSAGYLANTAFPTWEGNTAIAGHVTLPSGLPGPFAQLGKLGFGDEIVIHAWGLRYTYQVRLLERVLPSDFSVFGHEEYDWVTLITCGDYNEYLDKYESRLVTRAVLVSVTNDVNFDPLGSGWRLP